MELHDIITRIREGETAEFAKLVVRYRDMAFGYALTLLDQEQMAEDAVQEALLIAYTHLDRLRQPQAFGAWLRAIVRYRCSRILRAGLPTVSWEQMEARSSSDGSDPAHEAMMNAVREQVRAAIAELPATQQKVVQLYYEAGLSQQEIATRLNLTAPAVNMRLHTARARLRRRLQIMTDTTHEAGNPGRVQEAHGPVVTIQFAPQAIPPLFSRLMANAAETLCVVQHLSAGRVRAIATRATAIWTPGQEILDTGQPFTEALDQTTLQQAINGTREEEKGKRQLKHRTPNTEHRSSYPAVSRASRRSRR